MQEVRPANAAESSIGNYRKAVHQKRTWADDGGDVDGVRNQEDYNSYIAIAITIAILCNGYSSPSRVRTTTFVAYAMLYVSYFYNRRIRFTC